MMRCIICRAPERPSRDGMNAVITHGRTCPDHARPGHLSVRPLAPNGTSRAAEECRHGDGWFTLDGVTACLGCGETARTVHPPLAPARATW